jgi:hypothetical protein
MALRFYMDVNVPRAISVRLKLNGIDVLTAQEDGANLLDDEALLRRSTELQRVLFTRDSDFIRKAAKNQSVGAHFMGIVFAHQLKVGIGRCVEDLVLMALVLDETEMHDRIVFLPL